MSETEHERTIKSLAYMLGWENVPPRETLERSLRAVYARTEALQERIAMDNAVCICACPPEAHESYGEDGESCDAGHECIRVCVAARQIVAKLEQAIDELDAQSERQEKRIAALEKQIDDFEAMARKNAAEDERAHLIQLDGLRKRIAELEAALAETEGSVEIYGDHNARLREKLRLAEAFIATLRADRYADSPELAAFRGWAPRNPGSAE